MSRHLLIGATISAALALTGCGPTDEEGSAQELAVQEEELISCDGPQGDAYGNGPDGPAVVREIRKWFGDGARGDTALKIARCESGYWANCCASGGGTRAHYQQSSQYKGLFQMGAAEREQYGFTWCAPAQVKAAFHMWQDRGFSPWSGCL
jgi:hypothetical protein